MNTQLASKEPKSNVVTSEMLWQLLDELAARSEYWRNSTHDPHGISIAVAVAIEAKIGALRKMLMNNFGERPPNPGDHPTIPPIAPNPIKSQQRSAAEISQSLWQEGWKPLPTYAVYESSDQKLVKVVLHDGRCVEGKPE